MNLFAKMLLNGVAKVSNGVAESAMSPQDWDGSWVWAYRPSMPASMSAEMEMGKAADGVTEK